MVARAQRRWSAGRCPIHLRLLPPLARTLPYPSALYGCLHAPRILLAGPPPMGLIDSQKGARSRATHTSHTPVASRLSVCVAGSRLVSRAHYPCKGRVGRLFGLETINYPSTLVCQRCYDSFCGGDPNGLFALSTLNRCHATRCSLRHAHTLVKR